MYYDAAVELLQAEHAVRALFLYTAGSCVRFDFKLILMLVFCILSYLALKFNLHACRSLSLMQLFSFLPNGSHFGKWSMKMQRF